MISRLKEVKEAFKKGGKNIFYYLLPEGKGGKGGLTKVKLSFEGFPN